MKIAIVGWGVEGQSAYRYFGPEHDYLIVNEHPRDDFPAKSPSIKLQFLSNERPVGMVGNVVDLSYLDGIETYDKIIYSPSSYKNLQRKFGSDNSFWSKATTVQNIFFENCKSKNIIGVTGTKGKGTTSTLIYKMLLASGKKVFLGGNVGNSMLDFLNDIGAEDWVVLELSNFQLHTFNYSPHIAVCLMVVPEHLDWHENMDEYTETKANLFKHQKTEDTAIYFADNKYSAKIANYSPGKKVPFYKNPGAHVRADGMIVVGEDETEVINKNEVKLLGEHNLQNVCAAVTAVYEAIGSLDKAQTVLSSFSGLEHRLELVRTLDGVKYYNDSFAATPDAAIVAIEAIAGPKVMIMGGFDRNLPLLNTAEAIKKHSSQLKLLLIGVSAERLSNELEKVDFKNYEILEKNTMPEIVASAKKLAKPGDSVILSPGFPSFDMFKNFTERGELFKKAVNSL